MKRAFPALLALLCATLALLIATSSSPLYAANFWTDTNIYFTIGRGMTRGLMPYRDLFDHKGPLLFMLYALGAAISDTSFVGVFILEALSLAAAVYAGWRTVSLFGEGRLTLLEAEPLTVSVGIAAMKKRGESVNGDKGTYFKTDGGVLCVILSDGMGAGSEAAEDSGEAVAILERFLRSGVDGAAAMKILNSVMLLRNGEEWGFATADLMCVDLFTGETCFYKYGAAPSYVKTGKSVRRIAGESLAAGMTGAGASPDTVRMRLKPGSLALVASDGVAPGLDDGWLLDMLRETEEPDVKALARAVLRRAADEYGNSDDMTVLAVRVDERI